MRLRVTAVLALVCAFVPAAAAQAGPVATSDAEYSAYGRVFPDPQGGACSAPCSPYRQGNVAATQFIGYEEFESAITFMNQKPEWQRYLEVWPLDTRRVRRATTSAARSSHPNAEFLSAGLPTTTLDREQVEALHAARHRRDRARRGQEALRAVALDPRDRARRRRGRHARDGGPGHRARPPAGCRTKIVATEGMPVPVPDLRRRPEEDDHLLHLLRTPTAGGAARSPRAASSSSATTATASTSTATGPTSASRSGRTAASRSPRAARSRRRSSTIAQGRQVRRRRRPARPADRRRALLHAAPARHATTSPRTSASARPRRAIHHASEEALLGWSPIIQPNDAPAGRRRPVRADCAGTRARQIYGQTWGTVYDTINYTTTGALGDWFDSSVGPERGRHRQRDVVLAPRQEHHLRPAHRAAARGRQQGADLRAPRRDPRPPHAHVHARGPQGLRAAPARQARRSKDVQHRRAAGHVAAGRHRRGRHGLAAPTRRSTSSRSSATRKTSSTAACASTSPSRTSRACSRARSCTSCGSSARAATATRASRRTTSGSPSPRTTTSRGTYAQAGITAAVNDPQPSGKDGKPVAVARRGRTTRRGPAVRVRIDFTSGPRDARRRDGRRRPAGAEGVQRRRHRLLARAQPVHAEEEEAVPEGERAQARARRRSRRCRGSSTRSS